MWFTALEQPTEDIRVLRSSFFVWIDVVGIVILVVCHLINFNLSFEFNSWSLKVKRNQGTAA